MLPPIAGLMVGWSFQVSGLFFASACSPSKCSTAQNISLVVRSVEDTLCRLVDGEKYHPNTRSLQLGIGPFAFLSSMARRTPPYEDVL